VPGVSKKDREKVTREGKFNGEDEETGSVAASGAGEKRRIPGESKKEVGGGGYRGNRQMHRSYNEKRPERMRDRLGAVKCATLMLEKGNTL